MTDPTNKTSVRLDAFKDWLLQATLSAAFGAALWVLLIALVTFSLWHSPPNFDREISFAAKAYQAVIQLMAAVEQQPLVIMINGVLQHPMTIVSAIMLAFLLWLASEHVRLAIPCAEASDGARASLAPRIRLFSHRLGLVVVGLLMIFPGTLLLLGDGFVLLPVVLVVPYAAVRVLAWVIAALF